MITSGYRKFKSEIFDANIDKKELVNKSDISGIMNKKMETLGIKVELKVEQDKILNFELLVFEPSYARGKSDFENDGIQNYLVFQLVYSFFKKDS